MECKEQQEEELEVLRSIYEGDENFKEVSESVFQYKIGDNGSYKSFLVEISWGEEYPEAPPTINLDTFYNKHILNEVKTTISQHLLKQTEDLLGSAMTYTLFESVKEDASALTTAQPDSPPTAITQEEKSSNDERSKPKEKKEQLTKAQKRRLYNQLDSKGEKPRGWNWVDVVKHLSQTGGQHKTDDS